MNFEYSTETSIITFGMILCFIACSWAMRKKIDQQEQFHEYGFINGMRGLAAIFVYINHAPFVLNNLGIVNKTFSSWGQIYPNLGSFGVQIFFCITGFLFFDKVMKNKEIDWTRFFISRIKRVAPLYYASSALVILIAVYFANFNVFDKASFETVAGIITFNFIDSPANIGGVSLVPLNSITWTLIHEWRFYAALPIIFIFYYSNHRKIILTVVVCLMITDLMHSQVICWVYFVTGIMGASLYRRFNDLALLRLPALILCTVALIITVGLVEVPGYGLTRYALTSIFFILIILAKPKLLNAKMLHRLSDISYSIYLMHLPILFIIFKICSQFIDLSTISKEIFWSIIFLSIPFVVVISSFTYVEIEKRYMK